MKPHNYNNLVKAYVSFAIYLVFSILSYVLFIIGFVSLKNADLESIEKKSDSCSQIFNSNISFVASNDTLIYYFNMVDRNIISPKVLKNILVRSKQNYKQQNNESYIKNLALIGFINLASIKDSVYMAQREENLYRHRLNRCINYSKNK